MNLTLPLQPGNHTLDVLNHENGDPNQGSILVYGYGGGGDPITFWRGDGLGDDLLTGGQFAFHVVPEPASLWLLATGVAVIVSRAGRRRGDRS